MIESLRSKYIILCNLTHTTLLKKGKWQNMKYEILLFTHINFQDGSVFNIKKSKYIQTAEKGWVHQDRVSAF